MTNSIFSIKSHDFVTTTIAGFGIVKLTTIGITMRGMMKEKK